MLSLRTGSSGSGYLDRSCELFKATCSYSVPVEYHQKRIRRRKTKRETVSLGSGLCQRNNCEPAQSTAFKVLRAQEWGHGQVCGK